MKGKHKKRFLSLSSYGIYLHCWWSFSDCQRKSQCGCNKFHLQSFVFPPWVQYEDRVLKWDKCGIRDRWTCSLAPFLPLMNFPTWASHTASVSSVCHPCVVNEGCDDASPGRMLEPLNDIKYSRCPVYASVLHMR